MFESLRELIYIRVQKNAFSIFNVKNDCSYTAVSAQPFSTVRLAVGDFYQADHVLKEGITQVSEKSILKPAPIVVIHQQYLCEGGLSGVEERVLFELAHTIKAYKVFVWQGAALTKQELLNKAYIA